MKRRYSNKTLAALARFMESHFSHADLGALFLYSSVPESASSGANKLTRSLNAIRYLSRLDDFTGELEHADLLDLLFDEVIKRTRRVFESAQYLGSSTSETADSLKRALKADGYDIVEGKIVPSDDLEFELAAETSILEQKLQTQGMPDVINTLDQAHQNFIEGNYEACNAMLRASFESTLKHIAIKIAGGAEKIRLNNSGQGLSASNIRIYLKEEGFFEEDEIKFIKEFFGYASTNGSHPGISNEAESRLRRLMIVALIQYSLEKLQSKQLSY
ncbi:hypothetical protein FBR02_18000 [Anaerolineae bacterium CFX9]|nr:hypothetical protein [Anaerolineae bacterium CFX9]